MHEATEIPATIATELDSIRQITAQAITLQLTLPQTVALRWIVRLTPSLTTLTPLSTEHGRRLTVHLGDLQRGEAAQLVCAFLVAPGAADRQRRLARLRIMSGQSTIDHDVIAYYRPDAVNPPPTLLPIINRASIAILRQRAEQARQQGDYKTAAHLLRQLATRLHELAEPKLAALAIAEANNLMQQQQPGITAKELTYATRRLGQTTS